MLLEERGGLVGTGDSGGLDGGHNLSCIGAGVKSCFPQCFFNPNPGVRGHFMVRESIKSEERVLNRQVRIRGQMCLN